MAKALTPYVDKMLRKMIPLLASDQDSEVVATVSAIGKILKGAGYDFFDLADSLIKPKHAISAPAPRQRRTWREIAAYCQDHDGGQLSNGERRFVTSLVRQLSRGRGPSAKQLAWLEDIYAKLQGGRVG